MSMRSLMNPSMIGHIERIGEEGRSVLPFFRPNIPACSFAEIIVKPSTVERFKGKLVVMDPACAALFDVQDICIGFVRDKRRSVLVGSNPIAAACFPSFNSSMTPETIDRWVQGFGIDMPTALTDDEICISVMNKNPTGARADFRACIYGVATWKM